MDSPGCLCCKARTCLIIWCCLALTGAVYKIVPLSNPGTYQNDFLVISIIECVIGIAVYGFILFAAIKRQTKFLKLSFWIAIVYMVFALLVTIITIALYKEPDGTKLPLAGVIAMCVISVGIVGGLLAWTIRRTINEIENEIPDGYNGFNT